MADWDTSEKLSDWIVRHLERDFGMPARSARRVVEARMVLPVLDGLDEMDAADADAAGSRAQRALEALARHQDGADPAPLVLTCRTGRYDELEAEGSHILDAARIEIHPVDPAQAVRFLEQRGAARRPALWQPVLDELRAHPGGVLATALSTPWRLTLAATAYERHGDPGELSATAAVGSMDDVAELLLSRFIGAAAHNAPQKPGRYGERVIHARLHRLAKALGAGSGAETELVLLRLGRRVRRAWRVVMLVGLAPSVILPLVVLVRAEAGVGGLVNTGFLLVIGCAYVLVQLLSESTGDGAERTMLSAHAVPPLGSPLWRLGSRRLRRVLPGRLSTYLVLLALAYGTWKAMPDDMGGDGRFRPLLLGLALAAVAWTVGCVGELDSTAVGPGGAVRAGWWVVVFGAGLLAFPAASRGWGLDYAANLSVLIAAGFMLLSDWIGYLIYRIANPRLGPRLPAFLDWCVSAGLLRTSGIAYQFRHREFQEWLVRHSEPVPMPVPRR